jgi:hypothetical protein
MRIPACLLAAISLTALPAQALSTEEAYAAIPHQRTTFDAGTSKLPPSQVDSLRRLFAASDQGVVLKVEGIRAQRSSNVAELERIQKAYDTVIENLQSQKFSAEVAPARDLVVKALRDHKGFLATRPKGGMQFVARDLNAPEVTRASTSLHQAYDGLMGAFPGEPARNKQSFFDYLCALDYL